MVVVRMRTRWISVVTALCLPACNASTTSTFSTLAPTAGTSPSPDVAASDENREQPVTAISEPLGAVCRLQVQRIHEVLGVPRSKPNFFSSGAYIGDGLIVTAAHNVFSSSGVVSSKVGDVAVECGVTEHREGAGQIPGFNNSFVAIWPGYRFGDFRDDMALVRIATPAAASFDVAPDDVPITAGEDIYLAGFPGVGYGDGEYMFQGHGKILTVDANFLTYDIATTTGNSGGPVWVRSGGRILLVGVHVSGDDHGTARARRLSASRIARLKAALH